MESILQALEAHTDRAPHGQAVTDHAAVLHPELNASILPRVVLLVC